MTIQEFEETSDGHENRESFFGIACFFCWFVRIIFLAWSPGQCQAKKLPKEANFWVLAILPLCLPFHSLGMDRELQALVIVRSDGQDVWHGPQPLNDRSEFL